MHIFAVHFGTAFENLHGDIEHSIIGTVVIDVC